MEADATFIRAYGIVELNAVADIVLHFAGIVNPGDAERYDAVGLYHALDDFIFFKLGMTVVDVGYG